LCRHILLIIHFILRLSELNLFNSIFKFQEYLYVLFSAFFTYYFKILKFFHVFYCIFTINILITRNKYSLVHIMMASSKPVVSHFHFTKLDVISSMPSCHGNSLEPPRAKTYRPSKSKPRSCDVTADSSKRSVSRNHFWYKCKS